MKIDSKALNLELEHVSCYDCCLSLIMEASELKDNVIRIFRGNDTEQFESYIQFYDINGVLLNTKQFCQQTSVAKEDYSEDRYLLDLTPFWFFEWSNVSRIECHSDIKEICLSPNLRPKVGTIEFLDERRKDLIKRGKFSFIDEGDVVTQYDISEFFQKMNWEEPSIPKRKVDFGLGDPFKFPIHIEAHFMENSYSSSVRFFDANGILMNLKPYISLSESEDEVSYEKWTCVDLTRFLKECWPKVGVVECRSDLTAFDYFKTVKGNIDYLIYCKANNYKKLPEYLYKRIQTRKLDLFLADIKQ